MRRRCLGCGRLIAAGSRCKDCQRSYRDTGLGEAVKRRDGYRCRECGAGPPVEAHHVIPLAEGGADTMENMLTLCWPCHDRRHGKRLRNAATA